MAAKPAASAVLLAYITSVQANAPVICHAAESFRWSHAGPGEQAGAEKPADQNVAGGEQEAILIPTHFELGDDRNRQPGDYRPHRAKEQRRCDQCRHRCGDGNIDRIGVRGPPLQEGREGHKQQQADHIETGRRPHQGDAEDQRQ